MSYDNITGYLLREAVLQNPLSDNGNAPVAVGRHRTRSAHDYKFNGPLFTIGFHTGTDSWPDNSLSPKLRPLRAPDNV